MKFPVATAAAPAKAQQPKEESGGMWRKLGNQIIKPVASASNLLEDTGKTIGFGIANMIKPELEWKKDAVGRAGIDFFGHQKDVWTGKNRRLYSDIMAEIAGEHMAKGEKVLPELMTGIGVASDFILDPLNKLKILGLTQKGTKLAKTGDLALSAAEQAQKGERALLQFGNTNILPSVGNRVLAASTKANDVIRANKYGAKAVDALANFSTAIRPAGVARDEFKVIQDATRAFKKSSDYATKQAIEGAADIEKSLRKMKATDATRQALLHAVEKGDKSLVPQGMEEIFDNAVAVKAANEEMWKAAGGATVDNYGLPHVATDAVKEAQPTTNLRGGGKIYSPSTGQDIHRKWVRITDDVSQPLKIGDTIKAPDKGNYGKIISISNGTASVRFVNRGTKLSATVDFPLSEIENSREASRIANLADEGIEYGNTTRKGYTIENILESALKELNNRGKKPIFGTPKTYTPDDILRSALAEMNGARKNSPAIPLNRRGMAYQASTSKQAPLHRDTLKGVYHRGQKVFNVEQATAREINEALVKEGKEAIFKEDLPTALAVGGISSGKRAAGETFIKATKDKVKSDRGLQIIDETYQRLTNNESVATALKAYDKVLGVWKAQVLVAPSYHVRNEVGNLWNNYLAGTSPLDYATAAKVQQGVLTGKMDDATKALVTEMEQQGVIGSGWYGKDITQNIADEIGGASWNPLSQRFGAYRANRAVGTTFEDNARIAHYLSKRREGYNAVEAAKSVEKFLFDYGDLTWIEQNVMKRILPFYTWSRKNIPLQLEQFVKNPGRFAATAKIQKNVEDQVRKPEERYLSEYVKNNSPMRIRTNKDGSTEYLLLGQWLPAAQAIQFLSQPQDEILRGISPMVTIPSDMINNKSFFTDTLGENEPIEKYPGELKSFMGFDMRGKTVNLLRGIRVLNEIDKLNPGAIFGDKDKPSIFQGLTDNASETRGSKQSPDSDQASRAIGFLLGKTSNYDPANSKRFYDQDTEDRMAEYTRSLNQALRMNQPDLAKDIMKEMEQFNADRAGKENKHVENYNLMGERYFDDLVKDKQAEFDRNDTREKMREMIREGIRTGKYDMVQEAMKMDPTYAKDAIKDALKETSQDNLSEENKKMLYEVERLKTEKRLRPYYGGQ